MRPYRERSAIRSYETASSDFVDVSVPDFEEVGETHQLLFPDNRSKVEKNQLLKYPYNCVGLVISYFEGDSRPTIGTGFLVGERTVVTVAHNCYNKRK